MTGARDVGSRARAGRFPRAFNGAGRAVDCPACCHFKRPDWPRGGGQPSPPPPYKEGSGRDGASQLFAICLSPFLLPFFFCHGEGARPRFIGGGEGFSQTAHRSSPRAHSGGAGHYRKGEGVRSRPPWCSRERRTGRQIRLAPSSSPSFDGGPRRGANRANFSSGCAIHRAVAFAFQPHLRGRWSWIRRRRCGCT